jgi:hypothetical protein
MPTIDLPDDELAAVTAAIRRTIAGDRYPHAPRPDPLRAALARLDAAASKAPPPKGKAGESTGFSPEAPPPAKPTSGRGDRRRPLVRRCYLKPSIICPPAAGG